MHVLVTGGAGFIGSHFIKRFAGGAYPGISKISVIDNLTYAGNIGNLDIAILSQNISFIKGDICDSKLLSKSFVDIDAIINFAAESHVDRSIHDSTDFIKTNVMGVQVLLEYARKNKIQKFIQVSTDEVYGSIDKGSWSESENLNPRSPYAASKAAADLLVNSYFVTYNLNTCITRASNTYGRNQYPEKLIPFSVKLLNNGKNITLYGDGQNSREWLHVDDHCQGIYLVLQKGLPGNIYNIGGGTELKNIELAKIILAKMNLSETRIEFVQDRLGHDFRYSINSIKLGALGYSPKFDFYESIQEVIESYS